jgi:hypothetical protein
MNTIKFHPWVLAFIVVLGPGAALSQEDPESGDNGEHGHEFEMEIFEGRPTISLYYGLSDNSLEKLDHALARTNLVELRLGSTSKESVAVDTNILEYEYGYFSLTRISDDLGESSGPDKLKTNVWRIHLGREDGYGYRIGGRDLVLYSSFALGGSKLKVEGDVPDESDRDRLDLFDDTYRFGNKMEGGIKLHLLPYLTADAAYERAHIYPRFLFWKALVSFGLEGIANWLLDEFIDKILESSPAAVPVVNFFLKNGLSYGVYELREEDMNYPFETAPPFVTDSFKIGGSFVF